MSILKQRVTTPNQETGNLSVEGTIQKVPHHLPTSKEQSLKTRYNNHKKAKAKGGKDEPKEKRKPLGVMMQTSNPLCKEDYDTREKFSPAVPC
jgi:hypothetical protein